ncbi:MAG: YbbR-like domain-containing protein [Lachnospiraceae bacterium]
MKKINNLGLKILSVLFAILLWFLVLNINDPVATRTYSNIEVKTVNDSALSSLDKVYEIVEGDVITISVTARRSVLDSLRSKDFRATADLSKLSLTYAAPINVEARRLDSQIQEIRIKNNDMLKLKLEDTKERKLPVSVEVLGTPGSEYVVGTTSASPNIITIKGAQSVVNRIMEARVRVTISGITHNISQQTEIEFFDAEGNEVTATQLECDSKTSLAKVKLHHTKVVDLEIRVKGTVKKGYTMTSVEYEPKQITVSANKRILSDLETITIDDVSADNLSEDFQQNYDLTQYLPEGVSLAQNTTEAVVSITVEKSKPAGQKKVKKEK